MRLFADDGIDYCEVETPADQVALESDLSKLHYFHMASKCHFN